MRTLARHVLEDGDTPAVMEHAVRAVAGTLGVDRVQVFEQLSVTGMLAGWASIGADSSAARAGLAQHASRAIAGGEVVDFTEISSGDASIVPTDIQVRGGLAVVVPSADGSVFGALCAQTLAPRRFELAEVEFLRVVAKLISLAVERAAPDERASFAHGHDAATRLHTRSGAVTWLREMDEQQRVFALAVAINPQAHPAESNVATRDEVVRVAARRIRKVAARGDLVARTGRLELAVVGRLDGTRPREGLDELVE